MKTDRELLELAAKAAGIEWYGMAGDDECECRYFDIGPEDIVKWNPLTNDGDAFRLEVKLGLFILHSAYIPGVNAYGFIGIAWSGQREEFKAEHFTDDPYAATRRAIVRAAAAIGETS